MSITEAQRKERKNHLGSSDIPAIMGFSRWANAYDIWLLKTGRVEPKEKKTKNITAGNILEPGVLVWCSLFLDEPIRCQTKGLVNNILTPTTDGDVNEEPDELDNTSRMERNVNGTPIIVHMDGEVISTGEPIEGKTEGVDHPIIEPWGEAGTNEVPEYTCIQSHCHMMATDKEICHVPTFLGGRGFGYFFVKRDNRIVELIKRQSNDFWENNVLKDVPPENVAPSLAMAKRIRSVEGEPVGLDTEKVQNWLDVRQARIDAEKSEEFYKAEILAALDGVELGTCELGDITNFSQNRKGYTVEPTSFRVLRLKKGK